MDERFREILQKAFALLANDELDSALVLLKRGLSQAKKERSYSFGVHFARNTALVYERKGDLPAAARYYRISLQHDRTNAGSYYSLAELYERMGKTALARRYFGACRKIALKKPDKDLLKILDKRERG